MDEIPQVQDRRPKWAGVLPKNAQALVLAAIALLMILVILFSGHNAPKPKAPPAPMARLAEPDQARIIEYRTRIEEETRRLAAEEATLTRSKEALGPPPLRTDPAPAHTCRYEPDMARMDPEKGSIQSQLQKREYESLFASNIALSYREKPEEPKAGLRGDAKEQTNNAAGHNIRGTKHADQGDASASGYRLVEGTVLETVLTNRLDSSFSGPVNCMVTTNVYSHDGSVLLIPQGSRVLGEARKLESFGEQRLSVTFHRLILANGDSVSLDQFKGLDQIGATGLQDEINHHYLQVFGVSIALGAVAGLSQANTRYSLDENAADAYRQSVSSSLSQSAVHILDRYLNVLPTMTIREGYRVKIYLSQDLVLPAYDERKDY